MAIRIGSMYILLNRMKTKLKYVVLAAWVAAFSCTKEEPRYAEESGKYPTVFPNDAGATIPPNIAPLNFRFEEACDELFLSVKGKKSELKKNFRGNKTSITPEEWKRFLDENKGDSIAFTVYAKTNKRWLKYKTFSYFVAPEPIDEYLVYRLLSPGYQTWNKMGIYQRRLSDFKIEKILDNKLMPHTCMNCHALAAHNPDNMMLHLRENNSGTIIIREGRVEKLQTKTPTTFSSVSFPYWHPTAKYIAFSINKVRQIFPASGQERAHAYDMISDMVIYDVDENEFFTSPLLFSDAAYEAFPCFSPDGKTLYFVTTPAVPMPQEINAARYSLCAISFDPETGGLGATVDTLISASAIGKSVTMPRISPDGKHILLTLANRGNFPAYDTDADLYLYRLNDSALVSLDRINSDQVESYHSWSSNGRWVIFSSRRMDGLHMNFYIAYMDENGNPGEPFLLPQEDPDFHDMFLYSFNIPEFSVKRVDVDPYEIENVAKQSIGAQVKFDEHNH